MRFCLVSRADGGITVKVPSKETLRKLQSGEMSAAEYDAMCQEHVSRRAALAGASIVLIDDEAAVRAKLPFADGSPGAEESRQWRRSAMKWNAGTSTVEDDPKKTTETEIEAAAEWDVGNAIGKPDASRSRAERRLAAGRQDLLDDTERDDIIKRWRASGQAPSVSAFIPPIDAEVPPPIRRRR